MADLSDRIKELREKKGLSLRELADMCGTSKSAINMYERGTRKPKYETLEALADTFNVDMEYLLGRTDIPLSDKIENPPVLSEDERMFQELLAELAEYFKQMSREDQQLYLALLRRGLGKS